MDKSLLTGEAELIDGCQFEIGEGRLTFTLFQRKGLR